LFAENPEKYAPPYSGYCAYAMASGKFADIIPEVWKIFDGKLSLNFNRKVQRKWKKISRAISKKQTSGVPKYWRKGKASTLGLI